jgi:hypothetical protein
MQKTKTKPIFHLFLISLILFTLGWFTISPLTFSTSDVGLRFIQIRTLIAERWQTLAIAYPTEIDPDFQHTPYYYAFALVNGRIYFNISPYYPLIASWLYAFSGISGLVISPIIGTWLLLWGSMKLVRIGRLPHRSLFLWAMVFATPILFYSVQIWDHTLGTGLVILGIAFALDGLQTLKRQSLLAGGCLLGLALGQRPELYLFVAAFGLAWLIVFWGRWRETAVLCSGGFLGSLPMWITQYAWVGHPLGMATATHLLDYGIPETYAVRTAGLPRSVIAGNFLFHIEGRDAITFSAALFTIIGIGLLFFALRVPQYRKSLVLWSGTSLIILGQLIWGWLAWTNMVTGLISTFALFTFSVIFVAETPENQQTHPAYRFVLLTATLYIIGMLLFWPSFGARVWGSRYLLTAYPLLLFLSFYNFDAYRKQMAGRYKTAVQTIFMLLLFTSVGLQILGVRFNHKIVTELAADRDVVADMNVDIIMTNQPFWPALMASVEDKLFLYVSSEKVIEQLIPKLHAQKLNDIAVVFLESAQLTFPEQVGDIVITQPKPYFYILTTTEDQSP